MLEEAGKKNRIAIQHQILQKEETGTRVASFCRSCKEKQQICQARLLCEHAVRLEEHMAGVAAWLKCTYCQPCHSGLWSQDKALF